MEAFLTMGGGGLGVAIAWPVVYFLDRFDVFNAKVLGAVVSVIAGGTITTFLGTRGITSKVFPWGGYCLGLFFGVLAFGVSGFGRRLASQPAQNEAEPKSQSKDPRLRMLDELHSRYKNNVVDVTEYSRAKQKILSDIEKDPALRNEAN